MEERRHNDRRHFELQVEIFDLHSGVLLGRLADLSDDGFMLFWETPVEADSVLQFRFVPATPLADVESVTLGADCLWSRPGADDQHGWAGFHIIDIADDQAVVLQALLRHLAQET